MLPPGGRETENSIKLMFLIAIEHYVVIVFVFVFLLSQIVLLGSKLKSINFYRIKTIYQICGLVFTITFI